MRAKCRVQKNSVQPRARTRKGEGQARLLGFASSDFFLFRTKSEANTGRPSRTDRMNRARERARVSQTALNRGDSLARTGVADMQIRIIMENYRRAPAAFHVAKTPDCVVPRSSRGNADTRHCRVQPGTSYLRKVSRVTRISFSPRKRDKPAQSILFIVSAFSFLLSFIATRHAFRATSFASYERMRGGERERDKALLEHNDRFIISPAQIEETRDSPRAKQLSTTDTTICNFDRYREIALNDSWI